MIITRYNPFQKSTDIACESYENCSNMTYLFQTEISSLDYGWIIGVS